MLAPLSLRPLPEYPPALAVRYISPRPTRLGALFFLRIQFREEATQVQETESSALASARRSSQETDPIPISDSHRATRAQAILSSVKRSWPFGEVEVPASCQATIHDQGRGVSAPLPSALGVDRCHPPKTIRGINRHAPRRVPATLYRLPRIRPATKRSRHVNTSDCDS